MFDITLYGRAGPAAVALFEVNLEPVPEVDTESVDRRHRWDLHDHLRGHRHPVCRTGARGLCAPGAIVLRPTHSGRRRVGHGRPPPTLQRLRLGILGPGRGWGWGGRDRPHLPID